jgi:hypothetical protein
MSSACIFLKTTDMLADRMHSTPSNFIPKMLLKTS